MFASMTDDERKEFFRWCGRRGADAVAQPKDDTTLSLPKKRARQVSAWSSMTDEERSTYLRECGLKGAARAREAAAQRAFDKALKDS